MTPLKGQFSQKHSLTSTWHLFYYNPTIGENTYYLRAYCLSFLHCPFPVPVSLGCKLFRGNSVVSALYNIDSSYVLNKSLMIGKNCPESNISFRPHCQTSLLSSFFLMTLLLYSEYYGQWNVRGNVGCYFKD